MLYAEIAIENSSYSFDKLFTYLVPEELEDAVKPGVRVSVPFGNGNRSRAAMVFSLKKQCDAKRIKSISSVLDSEPAVSEEMLALTEWMKKRYFCTYFDAVKLFIPAGLGYKVRYDYSLNPTADTTANFSSDEKIIIDFLQTRVNAVPEKDFFDFLPVSGNSEALSRLIADGIVKKTDSATRKIGNATTKMVRCNDEFGGNLSRRQTDVYNTLCDIGTVSVKELIYYTGSSASVIKALNDKGAAFIYEEEKYRRPKSLTATLDDAADGDVSLSIDQDRAFDRLVKEYEHANGNISLLYGVTGSGKTSVFLKLIDYVRGKGKEIILMVPEISLTPQTIELFKRKFGNDIAVFHSGLSVGERLDEWKRAKRGEAKIAIGTRSAVFAPFTNLGLIVIDEEQEHTYKSETIPRYNAKEIAAFRIKYNKCFCLLSSATPSVETFHKVKRGEYGYNALKHRFGLSGIPDVRLIDMNQERLFGNKESLSFPLKKALIDNFKNKKQSIILLNRRGYHTFAKCNSCKEVISCPNCSISLTYHSANNRLMCHYCGYSRPYSNVCPSCGEHSVSFSGSGTQHAEEEIAATLPEAKILRLDADTTGSKYSLEKYFDAFSSGEYDVMVGTQMVAKGLNFENVTLVGVLSADQSLFNDDYRSNERTFDLLTQVVGRAGRGKYPGKALIQTEMPENPYLRLAAAQDYEAFFEMEIVYRQAMLYPPFADIILIGFVGENEIRTRKAAEFFLSDIGRIASEKYDKLPLRILRPSPATVLKVSGKYRYKIIIKCRNNSLFREMLAEVLDDYLSQKEFNAVTAYVDPNPDAII